MDIIRSSYYIHGPWDDENNFAVLYVSLSSIAKWHISFFYIYLKY